MLSSRFQLTGLVIVNFLQVVFAVQKVSKDELSVTRVQDEGLSEEVRRANTVVEIDTKLHVKGLHHKQHSTGQNSIGTSPKNNQAEEMLAVRGRKKIAVDAKPDHKGFHHRARDFGHVSNRMNLVEAITNPNGDITQKMRLGRKRNHLARNGKSDLDVGNHMHAVEVDPSGDVTDETALLDMAYDSNGDTEPAPATPVTPPPVAPPVVPAAVPVPVVVAPVASPPVAATPVGAPAAVVAPAVATPVAAAPPVTPPLAPAPPVASAPSGTPLVTAAPVAESAPATGPAPVAQPVTQSFGWTVFVLFMVLALVTVVAFGCWRTLVPHTNWQRTTSFPSRFADSSASPRGSLSPWQSSVPRSPRGKGRNLDTSDQISLSEGTSPWQSSVPRSPRGKGPDEPPTVSAGLLDPSRQKPHRPYRTRDAPSTEDEERQTETVADGEGGRN